MRLIVSMRDDSDFVGLPVLRDDFMRLPLARIVVALRPACRGGMDERIMRTPAK
jgi:hypothetical protein